MGLVERSFSINLRIMTVLRLYSPEESTRFFKAQAYAMYLLFIILLPILTLTRLVIDKDSDVTQPNDNASYIAQASGFVAKTLPFIRNSHQIKKCIHFFEASAFAVHSDEEKKIVDDCVRICRRNSMTYLIIFSICLVSWIFRPIFSSGRKLPLDIWLPFDPTTNLVTYYSVYLAVGIGLSYSGFCTILDPLLGGLACQAVGHLKVLKHNLRNLGEQGQGEFSKDVYGGIIKCIDLHNAILIFVEQYEECFSYVLFSQLAASVFSIGFCSLQLSMMEDFKIEALSSAVFNLTLLLVQIYFYCYYGTLMFEENYSLTNAIYMGKWYEYDVKSRRALIILMERSKRPMVVTVGKILELSLQTFTLVVRRAYSLLAVLGNYNRA